jgi:hypothetical protein
MTASANRCLVTEVVRAFQSALALLNQPETEPDSES